MAETVTWEQRTTTLGGIAAGFVSAAALWFLLWRFLPEPASAGNLETAFACGAVAALLTLMLGVEAIAHERLVTPAIDPLAGFVTKRMQVNFRYLSNTVEQYILFAAGLFGLVAYADSPRILVIVTIVWVVMRWAFWVGYHRSPLLRGIGAPGMIQTMAVLLYVAWRFCSDNFGTGAAIALIAIFLAIEAVLFVAPMRKSQ